MDIKTNFILFTAVIISILAAFSHGLNISPSPHAVITVDDELPDIQSANEYDLSSISRRGYAGDDFYQKAAKNVPRMGRRSDLKPMSCQDLENAVSINDQIEDELDSNAISDTKSKRFSSALGEVNEWPWDRHRFPGVVKRNHIGENCYYAPKSKTTVAANEICNEDFLCCFSNASPKEEMPKRYQSTNNSPKQTTSLPDYKLNRFK